jgi:hypothetical protein
VGFFPRRTSGKVSPFWFFWFCDDKSVKKEENVSALLRDIALHMTDDSLSSERNIFTATHIVFLHQIDRGALP